MGTFYIVATPIGNLEDISLRAIRVLFEVDVIAAEDTRRSGVLLEYLRKREELLTEVMKESEKPRDGKPKFLSLHDGNESERIDDVMRLLAEGKDVALVSDAGTPLVSDPGFKVVRALTQAGVRVVAIPGPVAWVNALVMSGMATNMVWTVGYLPIRSKRRQKELRQLMEAAASMKKNPTLVFYEAPHRLLSTLQDVMQVMGNVDVVLASEMTKLHEKVKRNPISLWIAQLQKEKKIRGEYTVVLELKENAEDSD